MERMHMMHVTAALVFKNNESAAMLVHQTNPVGVR